VENLLEKDKYEEFIADNHEHVVKSISVSMKKQKDYAEYISKVQRSNVGQKALRDKLIPDLRPVISSDQIEKLA